MSQENVEPDTAGRRVEPLVLRNSRCVVSLYRADCLSLLPIEADAVVSDPPYGMNYVSHHNSGRGDCDMVRLDGNFDAIIGDDQPFDPSPWLQFGTVALFGAQHFADRLPSSRGWLVWDKLAGKTPCGHSDCELVWTNRDMPVRIKTHLWRGIMRDGEENVVNGGKLHPNQKPVAVMSWLLEQVKIADGATVLDPYMGSGSTGVACVRRGLNFIGIEQDERYYEIAADRLRREMRVGRMF